MNGTQNGPEHIGATRARPDPGCATAENTTAVLAALDDEQTALLHCLAAGHTISSAAAARFLSLRTANRRIAEIRDALGVSSTRAAVDRYRTHQHPERTTTP